MTHAAYEPDEIRVFAGSGSQALTRRICAELGVEPGANEVLRFSEGNLFVRIRENVRGRRVYIVQSIVFPANDNFVELLFWIDAFKRASAESVTALIPYFSYAKGDKKDEPRVSIRARVCADAIESAGADRVVTLDLHAQQIQGFFKIPVDDLYAVHVLCDDFRARGLDNVVVVSPDVGFAKRARQYAELLGAGLAIGDKDRPAHDERARVFDLIGDVRGKTALIVDDFTLTCGSLVETAHTLVEHGAVRVVAAVTHGVFAPGSMQRLDASPIEELVITDSIESQPVLFSPKVRVVTVAPLLAEAIRRIHWRRSLSELFPHKAK
ncbi:MAG: ribose-phosphate pyrophosphokinase [Chloroflexi bacterium]|nr:ribose-phosphate pyrophosphokinase [Chloroflexota bacterium]